MSGRSDAANERVVHSAEPLNAEPTPARLRRDFVTPVEAFYVRSHGAIPTLEAAAHRVAIEGDVANPLTLSVADLQTRFAAHTVTAVLQCAGNRRADLQQVHATTGDPWGPGAIGNARWTGALLADVLSAAGAAENEHLHVAFTGADIADNEGEGDAAFGVSIPMPKAMMRDVLLAWAMNDEPLRPEHGAPLRIVVPGYAGVRSTKWVSAIRVQDRPSDAYQQREDYLIFPPDMRKETRDRARGTTIYEMPLNAAICEPQPGAAVPAGRVAMRGYAIATDRAVTRVDVSANGGRDWEQATIEDHDNGRWNWTFWYADIEVPKGEHELVARAWDAAGQTQPATPDDTWNYRGYLSAAWHRVRVSAA